MWIKTKQKPKECFVNTAYPITDIFKDVDWKLFGGTKLASILASAMILAYDMSTVIEIGLWNGSVTEILGKSLASNSIGDGLLISCDIKPSACSRSENFTKDLPIEHITVTNDSMKVNWEELLNGRKVDLAFVDGDHSYEYAMYDMEKCFSLLNNNGMMIVHDYSANAHPGVFAAVNEFTMKYNVSMFFLPENRTSTDYRTAIFQNRKIY